MEDYVGVGWFSSPSKLGAVLVILCNFPVSAAVSFCFHGNQDNVKSLRNQSCLSGAIHLVTSEVIDDKDFIPTTSSFSSASTELLYGAEVSTVEKDSPYMCMVFRYVLQEELSPEMSSRSVSANFSCDFQNWCKGRQPGLIYYNVSVALENTESVKGDLYCCDGNNCNMASVIRQLPPQQLCYKAMHYFGEDSYTGTVVSCSDPDAWCIRSRLFNTTPITTTYDCDNHQLCQHFNMTSGSSYVCRNVTQKSEKEEVCCCSSNVCFKPLDTLSSSIFGSPLTEQLDDRSAGIGIVTVGCIVAFTLLALVGGGVMVALMYQRRSQPSISALTLTYSRIEEDDVSDSVQML